MEIKETKYPGYFVTKDGRVFKEMVQHNSNGYKVVNVRSGEGYKSERVHRLIADTYLYAIPEGMVVNHLDGDKQNNALSNLEITTYRENNLHAYRTGLKKHVVHKLTDEDAHKILELYNNGTEAKVLADTFNVTEHYIRQLIGGRRKSHVRSQYTKTMRTKKKLSDELCAQMIRELLDGADAHTTATKYGVKTNYVFEIMRKEKRLNAWKLLGEDTPTIPTNKMSAETCARMITEVLSGLPKVEAQKKYGVSRSYLYKVLRKDFREDAWKLVEGSEAIRKE